MNFSIVIVTYNRKKHLERCLNSIKKATGHSFSYEVIIIFNGENSYMASTKKLFPEFQYFSITSRTPSEARNYGIERAKGDYLFFLDDDCTIAEDYFSKIDFSNNWDVLGGPDQTSLDATSFQVVLGHTLSSPLCTGMTFRRHSRVRYSDYDTNCTESSLILCNLWIKRTIFSVEGYRFSKDLYRNEENFLLKELKKNNKKLHYNPALYVLHYRKDNINNLAKAISKSGECRVVSFFKMPDWHEIVYLLPLLFCILFFYWIFNPSSLLGFGIIFYIMLICAYMLVSRIKMDYKIILLHFLILFFYSVGLLKGFKVAFWEIVESQKKRLLQVEK